MPTGDVISDEDFLGTAPKTAPTPAPIPFPTPTPAPPPTPTISDEDFLRPIGENPNRFRVVVGAGLEQDPARSAKILGLQARTGLATDLIGRNFDTVDSAVRKADFNADEFRRTSPVVAKWLSEDPARVGLTRDDLPSWAATEALVRTDPRYTTLPDGTIRESNGANGYERYYRSPRELRDALRERGFEADVAQARLDAVEDRQRWSYGAFSGIVAGLTQDAAQTAAAASRLVGGNPESTIETAGEIGAASEVISPGFSGTLQRGAGGLVAQLPLLLALGGPVAKGIEGLTRAALVGRTLTPIIEKGLAGAATMQPLAIRGALNDEHGTGHALGSWLIDSGIAGAFGPIGAGRYAARAAGVALAPTEAELSAAALVLKHTGLGGAQNIVFDVAHRLHDVATGVDPHAFALGNLLPSLAASGLLGALPASVFSIPEAMVHAQRIHDVAGMQRINQMSHALEASDTLRDVGEKINNTQSMELNQEVSKSLLQELAGKTPYRTLYLDSAAWRDHFSETGAPREPTAGVQEKPGKPLPDPRERATAATGDALAYDKAVSGGTQIAVPFERFIPLLNDEAHRDWFLAEARTAPEAMNAREAHEQAIAATQQAQAEAEATGPGSRAADIAASADLVHEDVKQQLLAAGRTESQASRGAQLWRAVLHTASVRGWTTALPHELHEQFKLRVRAMRDQLQGEAHAQENNQVIPEGIRQEEGQGGLLRHGEQAGAQPGDLQKEEVATGHVAKGHPVVIADVPYGGGTSADGKTVYIDRRIPRFLEVDGKRIDVHQMIAEHEIAEKARMDRGETYSKAHGEALGIEDDEVDHQGLSHADYERILKPYLDDALRAADKSKIPTDLEPKPYHDMGQPGLIEGSGGTPFAQTGDEAPRGTFLPQRLNALGESLISLGKTADESTFPHELAHGLLELLHHLGQLPDAPEALKTDLGKIRTWLGAKEGLNPADLTREQHEQFARGFEKFLMEGKAPSAALRGAFTRFKNWLLEIYKGQPDLRVHLTDELREVFDRILASDDEIAQARDELGLDADLFADQAESEMNPQQWNWYQAKREQGRERARELLEREALAPVLERESEKYQAEHAKTERQVTFEVDGTPTFAAIIALQKPKDAEGGIKLDRADLVRRYGKDALKALPGPQVEGEPPKANRGLHVYTDDGSGMNLDEAAQAYGFRDGGELWNALTTAPDRTAEIARRTDDALRAAGTFKDPLEDGSLRERARVAVANDPRLEVMDREADALAKKAGRAATPSELLRAVAKAQVEKTRAADLRPSLYRVAMGRESRAALKATLEARHATDPAEKARLSAEALRHKQSEILQTHLYREATKAVEFVEKGRAYVKTWDELAKRERVGKAGGWEWTVTALAPNGRPEEPETFSSLTYGDDPAKAQQAALDRANQRPGSDIQRSGYLEQADAIREGYDLRRVSNAALQKREALRDFIARKEANGEPIHIAESVVEDLGRKNWKDLTIGQMREVYDALKNLDKLATAQNKLNRENARETFREERDKNIAAMTENSRGIRREKVAGPSLTDTPKDIVGRWWSSMATVARLVREMDGHKDGGRMFETWIRPINDAKAHELELGERNVEAMGDLIKAWGKIRAGNLGLSIPHFEPAIGQSISHWGRIMVAMNWGNSGNRERLMKGHGWDEGQVRAVMAKLDKADMRFVQGVLDHVNSFWPEIKTKVERVTGIAPEKIEALPIVHPTGVYEGGYFPVSFDPRFPTKGQDIVTDEQATLARQGARLFAMTRHGFAEARTGMPEGARILLDPSVITRHLDMVAHDLAFHETLLDLNKLLRDKDWRDTMLAHWGVNAFRQFQSRTAAIAIGNQMPQMGWEKMLSWGRQGVNFANRALNVGFAVKQIPGLLQVIPRVGVGNFAKAMVGLFHNPMSTENTVAWIKSNDIEFRNRAKLRDKNIADRMVGVSFRGPVRQAIDAVGYYFFNKVNEFLDAHTWLASYLKAMDDFKGDHGKAVAIAKQTVVDIQGSSDVKDVPAAMRGGELGQVFTASMSWWLANYNLTAESINRARSGKLPDILKAGADLFVLYGVQVAAMSALGAVLTGDNKKDWENAIDDPGALAKSLAKDATYTALSSMVLARELAGAVTEGTQYRGPQGLRSISVLAAAIQAIRGNQQDETEAANIAKAAGVILHLPVAQITATANGLADAQLSGSNPILPAVFGPAHNK